ncbi:G-patch domain-containing [Hyphodiscus hymeniophilus]|uniref:G-patch domain-containing n=1 Tax=Hyphodiscus hymeniophilus TaxID=353542 RepID=A0A9P7B1C6_9HELO|nr:G-patch domain-containing [Hyphodiscus hymeniophilus]
MASMHAFTHGSSSESSEDEEGYALPSNDPNAEEFADFNPRKRRRTGRDSKESAALGIFGSESEDEGPAKRWKSKSLRGKGMAFVSTGQKNLDEDEDENGDGDEDDDDDEEEDDDDDDDPQEDVEMGDREEGAGDVEETAGLRGGLGLGFGPTASKGLGFQRSTPAKKPAPKFGTPLGTGFVPSSAAMPILRDDFDEVETPRIARPSAFSTPTTNGRSHKGNNAGAATPKVNAGSFAARMMAKMGYKEGQGLGKEGTGRSSVIEVQLRPQGVGLGAVREKSKQEKEEEKRQAKIKGEAYEDSDEERKKEKKIKSRKLNISGTDSGRSTPKRVKPKYQTVADIEKAAPGLQIPEAFAPILDMTGPGQRLLTTASGLLTPSAPASTTPHTEIDQEAKKLARRAQNDLSAFVEEWTNLQQRKAYVDMQILEQKQENEDFDRDHEQVKLFAQTVSGIEQIVKDAQWDPVIEALISANSLEVSNGNEELSSIAVAAVHPFLRQSTEGWQPLEDPKLAGMASALRKIRHILGAASSNANSVVSRDLENGMHNLRIKSTTHYESMIYKIIFPKIVSAINQNWDVHDPTPLLALLDSWDELLPQFVRSQILDQAVVGKLNDAVSSWNPRKRRHHEMPHLWLFPWLQYLPAHHADPKSSTGLVSDVKRKFRHLVDSWDFRKGVIPGLQQWREVLCPSPSNDHWKPLIMNHVLPSMARFLRNSEYFMVSPNDQEPYMKALQGIFAWKDILKPRIVAQVIIETVFPMWHSVLHQWLTVVGPNEEIGQWFEWWRDEVFPPELQSLKSIQEEFEKGHVMINKALDLGPNAATQLPAPHHIENIKSPSPAPVTPAKPLPVVEETTFRHIVENWCLENDLQFLAEKKILHSAGPLYRITAAGNGKNGTLVYFKGDSLTAVQKKGSEQVDIKINWENADARDALLEMAWHNVK